MDAFAVAVCKGLSMEKMNVKKALIIGGYFGFFQALMPLIGYFLGVQFADYIRAVDHWIAFVLLAYIGGKMIKESFDKNVECNDDTSFKAMIVLAVATSIDALASGVVLSIKIDEPVRAYIAVCIVGVITFVLSVLGVKVGNIFGAKYKSKAELAGGIVLVLLGLKILLEDLGVIAL